MRFVLAFPALIFLTTPVLGQDARASAVISELGDFITDIPALVESGGEVLADQLASLLRLADPTGVISDLPAIFSSDLPALESFLAAFLTGAIPRRVVPADIVAKIPDLVAGEGSLILSDFDALITLVPGTMSIVDERLPAVLSSILPEFGSTVEAIVSTLLLDLSKSLLSTTTTAPANSTARTTALSTITVPANFTTSTTTLSTTNPASTSSSTTSNVVATVTSVAAGVVWTAEIAGVVGTGCQLLSRKIRDTFPEHQTRPDTEQRNKGFDY